MVKNQFMQSLNLHPSLLIERLKEAERKTMPNFLPTERLKSQKAENYHFRTFLELLDRVYL